VSDQRFQRLEALKAEAAETLRLPISSDKVTLLAALRLSHEVQLERLVAGTTVDPNALLSLSEAIEKLAPELPPPVISVELVEGPIEHCPKCGWHRDEPLPPPEPPPSAPPPPTPPPTETKPSPPAPLPAAASNVVELPRRGGSIHDAVLPDGTPARMARSELWRYGAASDPVPDWGAAHSLPPIPPECFPK